MPPRPPKANPRRTTLGPVSMNNSTHTTPSKIPKPRKARQSMMPRVGAGGGQQSLIPPPSPSNSVSSSYSRRASIGGGGGGRKSMGGSSTMSMSSSTGRMHTSSNVKQDPRPIQDKTYQQHCIRTLLTYLTKSSYDYPVNLKSLAQPSGKDFQHIVTFLLKQVDPTFGTNDQKMEEEVALHFKALGYPYPVSKTALVAAGSPHTWPSLLAALAWLVEHIVVITACQEEDDNNNDHPNSNEHHQNSNSFESLGELEQKTDKAFFQYLHKAYAAFLEGSIERSDQLTEGLLDMFEEDNNIIEREIERVTDLNATMVEKINLLRQQSESLPALTKKRENYATDLEQFHDLVRQMDEHCAALATKVQERTRELQETHEELEKMTNRMDSLQNKITTQPLTVEQVQKMHSEQARLKEALEKADAFKQFNKEGLDKSQGQLQLLWEDLEMLMREYNEEAAELSRCMADFTFKMTLDKDNTGKQIDLLGVDIDKLTPSLEQCKQRNLDLLSDTRRHLEDMLDDLEASQEASTEASDQNKIVDSKLYKLEETLDTEYDQQEATLQVRLREVESIELNMESLRDPASLEEQICAYQRQCDTLERLRTKHQEEILSSKHSIQQEIQEALVAVNDYNLFVKEKLQELTLYADNQKKNVKTLPV